MDAQNINFLFLYRFTQTQAPDILFTCLLTHPRLRPAGQEEDGGEDGDRDHAGVRVPASPAPVLSLSSSPSPASIEGGLGEEGRPGGGDSGKAV